MAYLDDFDIDEIGETKAAWRRANSLRTRKEHAPGTPKGRKCNLRQKGHHAKKSKAEMPPRKTGRSIPNTDGKAHWPVQLPDWFRSTLNEQGDFALSPDIWIASPLPCEFSPCRVKYESEISFGFYESEMSMDQTATDAFPEVLRRRSETDPITEYPVLEADQSEWNFVHCSHCRKEYSLPEPLNGRCICDRYVDDGRLPEQLQVIARGISGSHFEADGGCRPNADVEMVDASTQCTLDDSEFEMRELKKKLLLNQIEKTWLSFSSPGIAYSVDTHFIMFEEPTQIARYASELDEEELEKLADRFFGRWIAGVKIESNANARPSRRVAEKHAMEAALIATSSRAFQKSLLMSAKCSLMGSRSCCGLLQRAHECPRSWAKLAHTALEFAGQLVKYGALPKAFAAECLRGLAALPPSDQGCKMVVLGLLIVIPAVRLSGVASNSERRLSCGGYSTSSRILQKRALTEPAWPSTPPLCHSLRRQNSAPPAYRFTRSIGTNLGTNAQQFRIYPCISVYGVLSTDKGCGAQCEIGESIPPEDVPSYWRHAIGGDPLQMEKRAREAEQNLGYEFCYCQCCLTEYRLSEPVGGICCGKAVQNERLPPGLAICCWKKLSLRLLLVHFCTAQNSRIWDDFISDSTELDLNDLPLQSCS